jgi:uncharacterized membrane protein
MVVLFFVFKGASIQLSIVVAFAYILTSSVLVMIAILTEVIDLHFLYGQG